MQIARAAPGEVIEGVGMGFGARDPSADMRGLKHPIPTRMQGEAENANTSRVTPAFTHGGWMCPVCTYGNPFGERCAKCEAVRPT